MAYTTHSHSANHVQGNPLLRVLTAAFDRLVSASERHPIMRRAAKLDAMSDAQLAQLGLNRDQIPTAALRGHGYL